MLPSSEFRREKYMSKILRLRQRSERDLEKVYEDSHFERRNAQASISKSCGQSPEEK